MILVRARFACLLLAMILGCAPAWAAKEGEEDIDYIDLASLLVQDGHYDRAEQALQNIPDPSVEGVDQPRYYTVYGLIYLNRNELAAAKQAFHQAIDAGIIDEATGKTPEVIYIYLAQIHFGLEEYADAIESLDKAGQTAARLSNTWTMRAHAHWQMGQHQQAFDVLQTASTQFPANRQFMRREVFYLVELGLYQRAAELGRQYLAVSEGSVEDFIAIGNALRKAQQYDEALKFLEMARLKFPENLNVQKVLAHTYLAHDQILAAADIFADASRLDPALIAEASELYRRAGKLHRALLLNGQIDNQEQKLKQRLAILLELENYDQITAMEDAMFRVGLLNDEDLRYALAYAWFKSGDFERAESHLTALTRPDLFRKAVELRGAMEGCADEPWRCS